MPIRYKTIKLNHATKIDMRCDAQFKEKEGLQVANEIRSYGYVTDYETINIGSDMSEYKN